jgi:NADH-quinone oxidoreductase subunit C
VDAASIIAKLQTTMPAVDFTPDPATDRPTVVVPREHLVDTCRVLRDQPVFLYGVLTDVTAVDRWPAEPRFEVVYHLLSVDRTSLLRLKVRVPGEDAHVPTIKGIWASAGWLEREVWDLFGVVFDGHDDLRRLVMPEDWDGHPLRKDYPVQITMKPKVYEPLQLTEQEFRANIAADRTVRGGSKKTV